MSLIVRKTNLVSKCQEELKKNNLSFLLRLIELNKEIKSKKQNYLKSLYLVLTYSKNIPIDSTLLIYYLLDNDFKKIIKLNEIKNLIIERLDCNNCFYNKEIPSIENFCCVKYFMLNLIKAIEYNELRMYLRKNQEKIKNQEKKIESEMKKNGIEILL